MRSSLILTVSGEDRTGLVEALAEAVVENGGNWEESRLSRLAGHFAGVVRITVDAEREQALTQAACAVEGLSVRCQKTRDTQIDGQTYGLELVGADHEGIVSRVSQALAEAGVSIDELWTEREEAPHAGGMLFRARATLRAKSDRVMQVVKARLEKIAHEVLVEISMD